VVATASLSSVRFPPERGSSPSTGAPSAALRADAYGGLARVLLEQRFRDPHSEPIHVIYLLPLPVERGDEWVGEMDRRKVRILGNRLKGVEGARTTRQRSGKVLVTDGPFAETKEWIAGFDILECANLDEAIEIAAQRWPASAGSRSVRSGRRNERT
jgi:hypothetical protein